MKWTENITRVYSHNHHLSLWIENTIVVFLLVYQNDNVTIKNMRFFENLLTDKDPLMLLHHNHIPKSYYTSITNV